MPICGIQWPQACTIVINQSRIRAVDTRCEASTLRKSALSETRADCSLTEALIHCFGCDADSLRADWTTLLPLARLSLSGSSIIKRRRHESVMSTVKENDLRAQPLKRTWTGFNACSLHTVTQNSVWHRFKWA